ncbi:AP-1 complex subunit sigma-1 [Tanacetum coccineum]
MLPTQTTTQEPITSVPLSVKDVYGRGSRNMKRDSGYEDDHKLWLLGSNGVNTLQIHHFSDTILNVFYPFEHVIFRVVSPMNFVEADASAVTVIRELSGMILTRGPKLCSFVEWRGFKAVYKMLTMDEVLIAGELQESSKKTVARLVAAQDSLVEVAKEEANSISNIIAQETK